MEDRNYDDRSLSNHRTAEPAIPENYRDDMDEKKAVLYEMLSGQQAFQGKTISDILASVLVREPDRHPVLADYSARSGYTD